jgi:hypothetical protein
MNSSRKNTSFFREIFEGKFSLITGISSQGNVPFFVFDLIFGGFLFYDG